MIIRGKGKEESTVLCGATLFFTILRFKKKKAGNQDECFKDFLGIIDPSAVNGITATSLHKYSSDCKTGKKLPEESECVRFGNPDVCAAFADEMKNSPEKPINRIKSFAENYFDSTSHPGLIRALLEIIEDDKSIEENNRALYINPGFLPSYKSDFLLPDAEISFYYFLLGAWFYVYKYCADNEMGADTIDSWTEKTKPYSADIPNTQVGMSGKYEDIKIFYHLEKPENLEVVQSGLPKALITDINGVAPDLGGEFDPENLFVVEAIPVAPVPTSNKFKTYMEKSYKKHSMKRTFVYDTERPFKDFYVCNDIARRTHGGVVSSNGAYRSISGLAKPIRNAGICDFDGLKNVIIGQGGLGKTMMAYHIFLKTIEEYDTDPYIPVFVSLSDYVPEKRDLLFLICQAVTRYDANLHLADVVEQLTEGGNVLLLDGFDEIDKKYIKEFIREVDYLSDLYADNAFVISSRNMPEVRNLDGFQIYDLQPLREEQAFEMIQKLDPDYMDEKIKNRFIESVKSKKFRFNEQEKRDFFGNPLFLTIMLITYGQTGDIPTQRYLFYEQAYRAMASRHDATKGISRDFFTKLNERDFQKMFGQFCADSYADHNLKFDRDMLDSYFQKVIDDNGLKTTTDAFFKDATEKLCLIYLDGTEYRFIHRSFQEYFAAYFFTTLMDDEYKEVYDVLMELDQKIVSDETISMLCGLDKKKFEKYIVMPFIESFVEVLDEKDARDYDVEYGDYLCRFYSTLEYVTKEMDEEMADDSIPFALFKFVTSFYDIKETISGMDFDDDEGWADDYKLYYIVEDYRREEYGESSFEYDISNFAHEDGTPYEHVEIREAGYLCSIDMHKVVHPSKLLQDCRFDDLFRYSSFPLRQEFDKFIELYKKLKIEYADVQKKKKRFGLGN